jgi:hypothetical protein
MAWFRVKYTFVCAKHGHLFRMKIVKILTILTILTINVSTSKCHHQIRIYLEGVSLPTMQSGRTALSPRISQRIGMPACSGLSSLAQAHFTLISGVSCSGFYPASCKTFPKGLASSGSKSRGSISAGLAL